LWQYGDELPAKRASFGPLSQIYCDTVATRTNPSSLRCLISLISKEFPSDGVAVKLKVDLLGRGGKAVRGRTGDCRLFSILLSSDESFLGLSPTRLELSERAEDLSRREEMVAHSLLLQINEGVTNPLAGAVISGLLQGLDPSVLQSLLRENSELPLVCLRLKPAIAYSPWFWRVPDESQRRQFDFMRSLAPIEDPVRLMTALIAANTDALAREFDLLLEDKMGRVLIEAIDRSAADGQQLAAGWISALRKYADTAIQALEFSAERVATAACLASLLNPYSQQVKRHGSRAWLKFFDTTTPRPSRDAVRLALFCYPLSMQNPDARASELAVDSFRVLHHAAWHGGVSDAEWGQIDSLLPHASWWDYWDRCDRLRRGLVRAFVDFEWPIRVLAEMSDDPALFIYLIKSANETKPGRRLLHELRVELTRGKYNVPTDISALLL
jgi:hypothetical protein